MTGDKYHIAPSMETSDQYSYLHAELKACRLQLQQAARRVSAALQAKDALEVKLDTAVTNQRELSNQLEAAVSFFRVYLNSRGNDTFLTKTYTPWSWWYNRINKIHPWQVK